MQILPQMMMINQAASGLVEEGSVIVEVDGVEQNASNAAMYDRCTEPK